MIKGYSKMDPNCTARTRLVDLFDQKSPPRSPISFQDLKQMNVCIRDADTEVHESFLDPEHDHNQKKEDEDDDEEMALYRSQSLYLCKLRADEKQNSAAYYERMVMKSYSVRVDHQNSTLGSTLRRVFSFRSSPCVSDEYRRIEEQYDNNACDHEENLLSPQAGYEKKTTGNIFEACRRFFGF